GNSGGTFSNWNRFNTFCPPPVASPATVTTNVCIGDAVSFTGASTGGTYQWRKDAVAIPTTGPGSNPSAATPTLSLSAAALADAGSYDYVITSSCGSSLTVGAYTLTVNLCRCNPADIAFDDGSPLPPIGTPGSDNNGVTEGDYNLFFATYFDAGAACDIANDDGSPLPPFGILDTNNGVTEGDYNLFFAIFFNGCAL
ncbi:MAG: hypothetical protein K2X32_05545, partial [Phycisphaerales bacterium]|nr:hypothetical protein [Phycisphaerales bacterium]